MDWYLYDNGLCHERVKHLIYSSNGFNQSNKIIILYFKRVKFFWTSFYWLSRLLPVTKLLWTRH